MVLLSLPLVFHGAWVFSVLLLLYPLLQHFVGQVVLLFVLCEEVVHCSYPHSKVLQPDRELGCVPLARLGDHEDQGV